MKNLYLFTVKFPYTKYAECFLEDEIVYLSKKFDHVIITTLLTEGDEVKPLPENVTVSHPLFRDKVRFFLRCLFNLRVALKMIPMLFDKSILTEKIRRQDWLKAYVTANSLLNSKWVKKISEKLTHEDVCYFYWGKWSNVLAYFWKGRCHMVSRFHGADDLWEESHKGFVPLRKEIVSSLDVAIFISKKGENYFHERYPECRTMYFPLGSNDIVYPKHTLSERIRVLSCSTLLVLKRVDLIYQSLLAVEKKQIEWTHIGDGPKMTDLKKLLKENHSPNIKVNLLGAMSHEEVLNHYAKHNYDLFINLSISEGVPVSIMEAISCDIPVVATDVGGNSEIVSFETGKLVSANPLPKEVASAINEVLEGNYAPRQYWERNYCANINYNAFSDFLSNL